MRMHYGYTGLAAVTAAVPFTFAVVAVIGLGAVVFTADKACRRKHGALPPDTTTAPTVTVAATVRQRRADQSGKRFYVDFETESGEQITLRVYAQDYGRMAEGDAGKLLYRGERFLGFYKT